MPQFENKSGKGHYQGRRNDTNGEGKSYRTKSYGDKPRYGEKSFGEKKSYGDKPRYGEKSFGEKKSYGDKPRYGEKSFGEKKSYGDKPRYGEKSFGEKKSYGDKPRYGEKSFGEKKSYGDKPRYGEKSFGEKKSYGDKPRYGEKSFGEKKSYGDKPRYGEKSFGEKKSYGDKPRYGEKSFGEKKSFGDQRRSFQDKPFRTRDEFDQAPRSNFADKSQEIREESPVADELLLMGRNAVWEALKAEKAVERVYLSQGVDEDMLTGILGVANRLHVRVERIPKARLNLICGTDKHQGVAATLSAADYLSLEELLDKAFEATENPLLVVLDEIQDPQNLGAIIRSAECAGAQGIIIPEHRAAGLTATVSKVSAGALAYQPVAKVVNLNRAMEAMRERGITLIGADMGGESYDTCDMTGPVALVIGNEGSGLRRLVSEGCDRMVGIPLCGHIDSLNASVATGILLFEALRQRKVKG